MAIVTLPLPNQIADGQTADAVPLMANMNYIANQVNANSYSPPTVSTILDTAYGYQAISTGLAIYRNTAFGYATLQVVGGVDNTAVGYTALEYNSIGSRCVAVGSYAMSSNAGQSDTVAIGYNAIALGGSSSSVAIGSGAMQSYSGSNSVAIGYQALPFATGNANVAIGYQSMYNTLGSTVGCVALGYLSLYAVTGNNNIGIGFNAGGNLTSGQNNILIGTSSGLTTQSNNVLLSGGSFSGIFSNSVAVGYNAMSSASLNSSASVAVGYQALQALTTGTNNTAIGQSALSGNTTFNDCSGLGSATAVTGSSQVQLGDAATTTYAYGAVQNRSDARDKADIRDTTLGLPFINSLRPVDYKWDMREDYRTDQTIPLHDIKTDGSKKRSRFHHGFIAQEVHAASMGQFGGVQHHAINGGHDVWSIGEGELIAPLVKAVQELSAELAALKAKG